MYDQQHQPQEQILLFQWGQLLDVEGQLLDPARPAPVNDNFDWDDFHGIEVDKINTVLWLHVFMNNKVFPLGNIDCVIVIL